MFNLVIGLSYLPLHSKTVLFAFPSTIVHPVSGLALEPADQRLQPPSRAPYRYSGGEIRWTLLTKDQNETVGGVQSAALSSDRTWNASPRAPSSGMRKRWLSMPKQSLYQTWVYNFRESSTLTGIKLTRGIPAILRRASACNLAGLQVVYLITSVFIILLITFSTVFRVTSWPKTSVWHSFKYALSVGTCTNLVMPLALDFHVRWHLWIWKKGLRSPI